MTISEYFDPTHPEHISAWNHLQTFGMWPEGFIPEGISFPPMWTVEILSKIADCWVEHMNNMFGE